MKNRKITNILYKLMSYKFMTHLWLISANLYADSNLLKLYL